MGTMIEWLVQFGPDRFGTAVYAALGAVSLWLCWLLLKTWRIRRLKRRMDAYAEFLRETFTQCGKPVPVMFVAYLQRDADRYDRSRRGWLSRLMWRKVSWARLDAEFLQPASPQAVPADGAPGEEPLQPAAARAKSPEIRRPTCPEGPAARNRGARRLAQRLKENRYYWLSAEEDEEYYAEKWWVRNENLHLTQKAR